MVRGVIFVHSSPAALCPHVEWALSTVLADRVTLVWTPQPAQPGTLRADLSWRAEPGTALRLAAALKAWSMLKFEITEETAAGSDGERVVHLPGRGIWRTKTAANGDVVLGEDQIRALVEQATSLEALRHGLAGALGADIDAELEPYRRAADGTPVTWLHQVG